MKNKVKWTDLKKELGIRLIRKQMISEDETGIEFVTFYTFDNSNGVWYLYKEHKDMLHSGCSITKENDNYILRQYNKLKF